ncbi:MAG: DUF6599 family protein [Acidobacteriota bacterium]
MMKTWVARILMVVSFITSQTLGQEPSTDSAPVSGEARKALVNLLPKGDELGARLTEGPAFYGPASLYEYIDGAAEAFIGYDFVALAHAVYQKGDAEIIVDIYDMGRPDNAFGIYSAERSPDSSFIAVGAEGYQGDFLLNFLHDRYYVKLTAFSESQKGAALLDPFARRISAAVGTAPSLPRPLSLFPADHLLPHTQTFVLKSPLGREFLSPAYSARYRFAGNHEAVVLLSLAENPGAAQARVARLRDHLQKTGEYKPLQEPPGGFQGSTRYEGKLLAFPRGDVAVIILNPPDPATGLVTRLLSTLDQGIQ